MNTNQLTIGILAVSLFVGLTPFIVENQFVETQNTEFNVSSAVMNNDTGNLTIGIASGEKFNYGELSPGVNVTKNVEMSTSGSILVATQSSGNASDYLTYTKYYYFSGDQDLPVTFRAEKPGYYEGNLQFKTSSPTNVVAEKWLQLKYSFYSLL